MIDIKKGGTIKLHNGKTLRIKPHSCREYLTYWQGNGASIESLVYTEAQDGEVVSDRIHLLIKPGGKKRHGFLMNIEDAEEIIAALKAAITKAKSLDIPRRD